MNVLDRRVASELERTLKEMTDKGELKTGKQLDIFYDNFRRQFGPEAIGNLNGEALTARLFGLGSNEYYASSLGYWLEFKNDEEFQTMLFGSIAGGSALKYGMYYGGDADAWMMGKGTSPKAVSVEEALEYSSKVRDLLISGAQYMEKLSGEATDSTYKELQDKLNDKLPEISAYSYVHKYFHLLYPEELDCYHVPQYQTYHLIKLLEVPPEGSETERYLCAGRYVGIAKELGLPICNLMHVLNKRDGRPHRYWQFVIGSEFGNEGALPEMVSSNTLAAGWPLLGDLAWAKHTMESKKRVKELVDENYSGVQQVMVQPVFNFTTTLLERDLVLVVSGNEVVGTARIAGGYFHKSGSEFPHRRPVEWLSFDKYRLPLDEQKKNQVVSEQRQWKNMVETEKNLLGATAVAPDTGGTIIISLTGLLQRIDSILERKGQVILYGPPGTGKTYWAEKAALGLSSRYNTEPTVAVEPGNTTVRICCFHPAYGYEDFIEGYKPKTVDGRIVFELTDGIFKRICKDAEEDPQAKFYLIIDEINRGDIPRIFGELLTVLEKDKRGKAISLPLSGEAFRVPENVYILGTMNTADRSIALLDTALRRRFGFIELMPDTSLFKDVLIEGIPLGSWLDALNTRIREQVGRDARNLQIGHSYFLEKDGGPVLEFSRFARIIQEDIIPLLQEYCYEDYKALEKVIGKSLVDAANQEIRTALFENTRQDELIQALLEPFPEIATDLQTVATEVEAQEEEGLVESDEEEQGG